MLVLNPRTVRRSGCAVWPHEALDALGIAGTVHELWLQPVGLKPMYMPKQLQQMIPFEVRLSQAIQ